MAGVIEVTIPGDPVAKGQPRMTRSGIAYTPVHTRNALAYTRMMMAQAMNGQAPLDGALHVAISIFRPIRDSWSKRKQEDARLGRIWPTGRPDLDNYIKTIADAGNGVLWRDDAQIVSLDVAKLYGDAPCAVIRVDLRAPPQLRVIKGGHS